MARAYVSVGSNIDRERNVKAALDALSAAYGELHTSSVFESEPVGFEGDPFYNLAVGALFQRRSMHHSRSAAST